MTVFNVDVNTGEMREIQGSTPEFLPTLEEQRAAMSITRGQFLLAAMAAGIIDEATAEEAADGSWPTGFDVFLSGLTVSQRVMAKSTWVDGDRVRRNNPILAIVAQDQNLSDADLDNLFLAASQIEV